MVRVGFVRWYVECGLINQNHGMTRIQFRIIPQADTYRSLVKVWHGTRSELVGQDIAVEPLEARQDELTYDLKAGRLLQLANSLAAELADNVVRYCVNKGIVDYKGYDQLAANYIVKTALVNAAISGVPEEVAHEAMIDLVPDMRACVAERERIARGLAQAAEEVEKATAISFELLYSFLTVAERTEAQAAHTVTVKTDMGDFKVPVSVHGLVKQYVNGLYKASYCVVFQDHRIPVGDEALMKIALLKVDPHKFIKTANKFYESNGRLIAAY